MPALLLTTVEPMSKGHFGTIILSLVQVGRLSSFRKLKSVLQVHIWRSGKCPL